jgi:hypothetical protein
MRFDSLILELQTEIRAKNSQMKDTWRHFEEAVVAYEKISSVSTDIPESVDEESEPEDIQEDAPSPREASEGKVMESEEDDEYYDKAGLSMAELADNSFAYEPQPTKSTEHTEGGLYNNYMDKSLLDRSRSATTDGEDNQSTLPLAHTGTFAAPGTSVVIPETNPGRPAPSNGRPSIGSVASSKLNNNDSPKRKAQAKCKRLQHLLKALEASIAESQYKLVFTREDYQRSLQALDDLEDELCTISTRFEEDEKESLGHFFSALQTKQDQSIVEVYKDLKEYRTRSTDTSHRGTKRKRTFDQDEAVSLLAVAPVEDHDDRRPSKTARTQSSTAKSVLKTFLAIGTVTAIAAATGIATGHLPPPF